MPLARVSSRQMDREIKETFDVPNKREAFVLWVLFWAAFITGAVAYLLTR